MWRAMFLAVGLYAVLVGAECLVVEKAVLAQREEPAPGAASIETGRKREFVPPDWAPWSLMSTGAVTMLYSITLPKKA